GCAGGNLRSARAEWFGEINADSNTFDTAHSGSWRSAFDGAPAPGRRTGGALEDRTSERRRRVLQEAVGSREPALLGLSLRPRAEGRRKARLRHSRAPGHRVAAVFRPAGREEPRAAAERL